MATFRGFIAASGSWAFWSTGDPVPAGISFVTQVAGAAAGTTINFSSSLTPVITDGLSHAFDFTQGIARTITNVTDSVSGFVINGGSQVADGWAPLLRVSTGSIGGGGAPSLSQFSFKANNGRKFIASGSNSIIITGSMTVEFIAKHDLSLAATWDFLVGNYDDACFRIWKQGSGAPNRIRFDFDDDAGTNLATNSSSSLPLEQWFHVVCTREVTAASSVFITQSIYINGQFDAEGKYQIAGGPFSGSQTFYVGGNGTISDNWEGDLIFVRIYTDKVFTASEVRQTYSASLGKWQNEWFIN